MTSEYKKTTVCKKNKQISSTSTIMTVTTIKEPNNVSNTDGADTDFFCFVVYYYSIIHKKQFAYNTHQDYNYPSLPSTAHATLKGGSLTLPATVSGRDTVIAKIRIKSNWMGLLFLPFVETISSKGKWSNISNTVQKACAISI